MHRGSRLTLMDETLADFLHRSGWVTFPRTFRRPRPILLRMSTSPQMSGPSTRRRGAHVSALFVLAAAVVACGGSVQPSNGRQPLPTIEPSRAGTGVIAQASGEITRQPESVAGLIVGVSYEYRLGAYDAHTPTDFDGSLWDPDDPAAYASAAGSHGYVTLMSPTTATFRSDDGSVLVMQRHIGAKTFSTGGCH